MTHFLRLSKFYVRNTICALAAFLFVFNFGISQEVRSVDGFGNNKANPELGSTGSLILVNTVTAYSDSISSPAAPDRENPRVISNVLFSQEGIFNDKKSLSDYNWVFGQFIDHDISLVDNSNPNDREEVLIIVPPADDKFFGIGQVIPMMRSKAVAGTGTNINNPRRHANEITSFLDGSNIYGSDETRAIWLRSFIDGKLKVSSNNLLPWNTLNGEFNSTVDPSAPFMADDTKSNVKLFVAGDIRANENPLLIAVHTLFVREHNRQCTILKNQNPTWDDEQLYQHAKRLTTATLQSIAYNEWLPAQGIVVPAYQGYSENIDPSISNVFSAAAFRMGHTLINSNIIRMDNKGNSSNGQISLRDAFFNPFTVNLSGGIEPFLKGMGTQVQQELDCKIIDDVRNFLFGAPGEGGLDLAAININRGRERGLPDYNTVRENFGLPRVSKFTDICSDINVSSKLELLYGSVNNIDPWVGMLAEDHMKNAIFGELVMTIVERQFRQIRDGDRFYYANDAAISEAEKEKISKITFQELIMNNTEISLMQPNVFVAMEHYNIPNGPELDKKIISAAIYPNPISPDSKIKIYSKANASLTISMFDNLGQVLFVRKFDVLEGDNILNADFFFGLPKGAYNIKIEDRLGVYTVLRAIL